MQVREFNTVQEAVYVLGRYTTVARLQALEALGVNLDNHTHRELAQAVRASREKVTKSLGTMGRRRKQTMNTSFRKSRADMKVA